MSRKITIEIDDVLYRALAGAVDTSLEPEETKAEQAIHKLIGKAAAAAILRYRSQQAILTTRQEIEGKVVSVSTHPLPELKGETTPEGATIFSHGDLPPLEVTGIEPEPPPDEPPAEEPEKKNDAEHFPENVPFAILPNPTIETIDDGPVLGYAPRVR